MHLEIIMPDKIKSEHKKTSFADYMMQNAQVFSLSMQVFAHFPNPISGWNVCTVNKSWDFARHIMTTSSTPSVSVIMLSFPKMPLMLCCSEGRKKTPEVNRLLHFFRLKWLQKLYRYFLRFIKPVRKDQLYKVLWHADVNSHWRLNSWALKGIRSRKNSDQEITAGEFKNKRAVCLLWN